MHYLSQFESIGDNCEFAFVQRAHGVEDGSLFKWARIKEVEDLQETIENDFQDAFLFGNIVPVHDDMVMDVKTRIFFHSDLRSHVVGGVRQWKETDVCTRGSIYKPESEKRQYLVGKFRQTASTGEKIFVYKSNATVPLHQYMRLFAGLRRYGPARLLVVEWTRDPTLHGSAKLLEDGIAVGYLSRFAPYGAANDFCREEWESICRQTISLLGCKSRESRPAQIRNLCSLPRSPEPSMARFVRSLAHRWLAQRYSR
jgi:hypothetical protein